MDLAIIPAKHYSSEVPYKNFRALWGGASFFTFREVFSKRRCTLCSFYGQRNY